LPKNRPFAASKPDRAGRKIRGLLKKRNVFNAVYSFTREKVAGPIFAALASILGDGIETTHLHDRLGGFPRRRDLSARRARRRAGAL
jgi:hypothetical protein